MKKGLAKAVNARRERIGSFSDFDYEFRTGKTWELEFDGSRITYVSNQGVMLEEYVTRFLPYELLDVDTLLDIYLVVMELEAFASQCRAEEFWEERWQSTKPKNRYSGQLSVKKKSGLRRG